MKMSQYNGHHKLQEVVKMERTMYNRDEFFNEVLDLAYDKYDLGNFNLVGELATFISIIVEAEKIKDKKEKV